jgi:branched-chain amino acid transport system permease protein
VIPALNPSDARFEIGRVVSAGSGDGVRVNYRAEVPGGPSRDRFVECHFSAGNRASPERGVLIGVSTDSGRLGELRLQVLKRFWLEAEGSAADPEPVPGASMSPQLPRPLAVGLQHALFALPSIAI